MRRQYIYDVFQRILHWWLALSTLTLVISGLIGSYQEPGSARSFVWSWHITAGKILAVGLIGRIAWGIIGPAHARFTSFFHFSDWMLSVKGRKLLSADTKFGHHSQASISYLGFYLLIFIMVASGFSLAAILHGEGPLANQMLDDFSNLSVIQWTHENGLWLIIFFIVTHIAAIIFHEWKDKIPIAQSMISGYQYRTKRENQDDNSEP